MSLSPFLVLTQEKETKESQAPAGGVFLSVVGRGRVVLAGMGFLYL